MGERGGTKVERKGGGGKEWPRSHPPATPPSSPQLLQSPCQWPPPDTGPSEWLWSGRDGSLEAGRGGGCLGCHR